MQTPFLAANLCTWINKYDLLERAAPVFVDNTGKVQNVNDCGPASKGIITRRLTHQIRLLAEDYQYYPDPFSNDGFREGAIRRRKKAGLQRDFVMWDWSQDKYHLDDLVATLGLSQQISHMKGSTLPCVRCGHKGSSAKVNCSICGMVGNITRECIF